VIPRLDHQLLFWKGVEIIKFKENTPENIDQWQTFLPWNTVWGPLETWHPKHEQLDAQSTVMLPDRLPYQPV